ncbi:hypothetical protein ACROYT_G036809 [Oculina patagonica]
MNKITKLLLCVAFVLKFTNQIVTKPLFLKKPLLQSQPIVDAFETEERTNQESGIASEVKGFSQSPTTHNRTARRVHPCVSGIVREYDRCRNSWVMKMLLWIAFALELTNEIATKPLVLTRRPLLQSQQIVDAFKTEESINHLQESDPILSEVSGFSQIPTTQNRTARRVHPCVSGIVREYNRCRKRWVMKVQCDRAHPACNHVIPIHSIPRCQTVYGFRNSKFISKCPSLPIDCKCAS